MSLLDAPGWYPEDPDTALLLADTIVVVHFAIVLYVILGQLCILVGWPLRWSWVRNRWFRLSHLGIIVFVAAVAAMGDLCPLTIWENDLRRIAGKPIEKASFVAHWAHEVLFVEVDVRILGYCYIAFCLLVIGSLWFVPVRWRRAARVEPA